MSVLFSSVYIGGMALRNRFVRAATYSGMADQEGRCTRKLAEHAAWVGGGGAGLVITGHAFVRPDGRAATRQLGLHGDSLIPDLKEMTARIHDQGCAVVAQLAHAGVFARDTGQAPRAVSLAPGEGRNKAPEGARELTVRDIRELASSFVAAAGRAREAGFDGVELHAAHGYLLSQFLSPLFNHRRDRYGGSVENRVRLIREIVEGIREKVAADYPVLVKLNGQDYAEGGLGTEDAARAAALLCQSGVDAVELSGGLLTSRRWGPSRMGVRREEQEAYFRDDARRVRASIDVPLILVGGIRSFSVAEKLLDEGTADLISMSRPFIREPGLVERWRKGDRRKSECDSDNRCFRPALSGQGVYCVNLHSR